MRWTPMLMSFGAGWISFGFSLRRTSRAKGSCSVFLSGDVVFCKSWRRIFMVVYRSNIVKFDKMYCGVGETKRKKCGKHVVYKDDIIPPSVLEMEKEHAHLPTRGLSCWRCIIPNEVVNITVFKLPGNSYNSTFSSGSSRTLAFVGSYMYTFCSVPTYWKIVVYASFSLVAGFSSTYLTSI